VVDDHRKEQGLRKGKGVQEPLGVRESCLAPLPCLVRIPQQPQAPSAEEAAGDARVLAVAQGVGTHLLRVIQGQSVLRVGEGEAKLPENRQGRHQRPVGLQEQHGVLLLPGHAEEFLPHRARGLDLRPRHVRIRQPPQRREELWYVPHLPA
jgi:hypothetical protein